MISFRLIVLDISIANALIQSLYRCKDSIFCNKSDIKMWEICKKSDIKMAIFCKKSDIDAKKGFLVSIL